MASRKLNRVSDVQSSNCEWFYFKDGLVNVFSATKCKII